jgi:o-succinylbenzoate---CoA ligase
VNPVAGAGGLTSTAPLSTLAAASERPDGTALVVGGLALDWAELSRRVAAAAGELLSDGVLEVDAEPGLPPEAPRVAVLGERRLETVIAVLALVELGVPFALLHPRWTEVERRRILDALRPGMVLDESWHAHDPVDAALRSRFETARRALDARDDERALAVIFTSGTSGTPKGAVLSRRAFLASARASEGVLGWRDGDRWLLSLPLAHVGGLSVLTRCLAARRTVVLDPSPSFSPESFVATVNEGDVTIASLVPTMLHRLLTAEIPPPPSLRVVLLGGARASASLLERARAAGWPVLATYGLTEACSQVATQRPSPAGRGPSADTGCGPPLPGFDVRIASEVGRDPGGPCAAGEIELRGESLFSGYLRIEREAPRFDRTAIRRDGFFATGDLGTFDDSGCLHVLDRRTDLIVSGGENVYPAEVEQVLERCPGIVAACVFGVEDLEWGQVVAAALVAPLGLPDDAVLRELLEALAAFKRPRRIVLLDELPLLANGKVNRSRCRELVMRQAG